MIRHWPGCFSFAQKWIITLLFREVQQSGERMEKTTMKYSASSVLVLAILVLALTGFLVPGFRTSENSENRTMATFDMVINPDPESVAYRDSPVERLDAALSDQFPFREKLIRKYLLLANYSENLSENLTTLFVPRVKGQYTLHTVGNYEQIENTDYITIRPHTKAMNSKMVAGHIEQIEHLHREFPDLGLYVYYVTQAFDTDWFDYYLGVKSIDRYQQIVDALPDYVKCCHLVYQDLDDYMNIHYKTDHHMNHRGALREYQDVYALLKEDYPMGEMMTPQSENRVSETYNFVYLGSYGRNLGDLYKGGYDEFFFYEYDFPEETYAVLNTDTLEETEVVMMGVYDEYREGKINRKIGSDHYINMYRTAVGADGTRYSEQYPYIIRNSKGNGVNLLICGDSYNRGMRDLLASHFDTLVYFDYRILRNIPIDYLIRRYDIDALLISSNTSMWRSDEYLLRFEEEGAE